MDRGARRAPRGRERAQAVLPADPGRAGGLDRRRGAPRPAGTAGAGAGPHRRGAVNRIYRALLPLAPPALRARHGADMEALFEEPLAAPRTRGRGAILAVW